MRIIGSAPRVRGTEAEARAPGGADRLQPRVCGERRPSGVSSPLRIGSAPRVRGTAATAIASRTGLRFSPACAGNGGSTSMATGSSTVQPRVCGERRRRRASSAIRAGSAPRVRGTVAGADLALDEQRFSPACAGNGAWPAARNSRRAVQPRVCGERDLAACRAPCSGGSAPRVRGTVLIARIGVCRLRFSPACAGNGICAARLPTRRAVQPRVCGERPSKAAKSAIIDGSAPRVRGTGRAP